MNYQTIYDELKALQNRAFNLSKNDRDYIKRLSKDFNIEFVVRGNCKNCYNDQIIMLAIHVKKLLLPVENKNCKYVVIGGKNVLIKGRIINDETITDELAEWLIRAFKNHDKYIKLK